MGRPRGFNETAVLEAAAGVFVEGGYEGSSIDDLLKTLNLHRGSLYQAFGSKRGLFLAVLRHHVDTHLAGVTQPPFDHRDTSAPAGALTRGSDLDLLLVAAQERGHRDAEVAALVRRALASIERAIGDSADPPRLPPLEARPVRAIELLGIRLYERLNVEPEGPGGAKNPLNSKETPWPPSVSTTAI